MSSRRLDILRELYAERQRSPTPSIGVEDLAAKLSTPREALWKDVHYLEQSGYVVVKSRVIGTRVLYSVSLTTKGIDVVEGRLDSAAAWLFDSSTEQHHSSASLGEPILTGVDAGTITPPRIFISHSHHDNEFCKRMEAYLKGNVPEVDIFLDLTDLLGGQDYMIRIPDEVIQRPVFIVVLSEQAIRAPWVQAETHLALHEALNNPAHKVIPIRASEGDTDILSPLLRVRHIIDCLYQNESQGFEQLVRAIRE